MRRFSGLLVIGLIGFILAVCLLVREKFLDKSWGDFLIFIFFSALVVVYGLEFRYRQPDGGRKDRQKTR